MLRLIGLAPSVGGVDNFSGGIAASAPPIGGGRDAPR